MEFDKQDQVNQVKPFLLENEVLHAVFDCKGAGTGFIAISDKRVIFYDKAFLAKRKALTSVPFEHIAALSAVDEGRGMFGIGTSSELVVRTTGAEVIWFEFRGGDKAQRAYALIMGKVLRERV